MHFGLNVLAQDDFTYQTKIFSTPLLQAGIFGENAQDIIQFSSPEIAPPPGSNYQDAKQKVNKLRENYYKQLNKGHGYINLPAEIKPKVDTSFNGQFGGTSGVPCDNHIAVSNEGKIISVQNSTIRVLDETGKTLLFKSLFAFANGKVIGLTSYCYDPKVIYDPQADRFIVFFLHESKVASNFGILAFSKTNDPTGGWNFYKIPGNALKNNKWSDYPIMAISKEDVFITLNLLTENTDWRVGFNQSLIWQINKKTGYSGDTLLQKVYFDIQYKSKAIWSICPVQGGHEPTHPSMYFLSVRPGDLQNDTLFVHEISNTLSSNAAKLSLSVLTTDLSYGVPPVAPQPMGADTLQTNDCRVLGAIYHNGKIQYVQTSVVKPYYHSGILHGMFSIGKANKVRCTYISTDTTDYAYPSIAYAGSGQAADQASVITFSNVSTKSFPGTSAIYHNQHINLPSLFSDVVRVKDGENAIERLSQSQAAHERWGDYTGIQLKYNEQGTLWLVGTYGNANKVNGTWIGKLRVKDNIGIKADPELILYPNPSQAKTAVGFNLDKADNIKIEVINALGQLVKVCFDGPLNQGYNELYLDVNPLAHGTYYLIVKNKENTLKLSGKLIK